MARFSQYALRVGLRRLASRLGENVGRRLKRSLDNETAHADAGLGRSVFNAELFLLGQEDEHSFVLPGLGATCPRYSLKDCGASFAFVHGRLQVPL